MQYLLITFLSSQSFRKYLKLCKQQSVHGDKLALRTISTMLTCVPLFPLRVLGSFCGSAISIRASDGLHLEHEEVGIAQYLLTTFLPSQSCRKDQ